MKKVAFNQREGGIKDHRGYDLIHGSCKADEVNSILAIKGITDIRIKLTDAFVGTKCNSPSFICTGNKERDGSKPKPASEYSQHRYNAPLEVRQGELIDQLSDQIIFQIINPLNKKKDEMIRGGTVRCSKNIGLEDEEQFPMKKSPHEESDNIQAQTHIKRKKFIRAVEEGIAKKHKQHYEIEEEVKVTITRPKKYTDHKGGEIFLEEGQILLSWSCIER